MNIEDALCPTCKGDCCVNKRGSVVEHGSALALHSCPDCEEGLAWTAHTEPAPAPGRAAADERADMIAFLRQLIEMEQLRVLEQISKWVDAIERGGHVGWSKDTTTRKAILDRESYRP